MTRIFRSTSIEVANRLEQLGWTREELLEVVDAMVASRNSCTDNDPSSAPGWMSWKDGTRRLREIARPKGLEKSEADQIPWAVDVERGIRFAVSNTDNGTGLPYPRQPQNRSKKGPATDRAISSNQGCLFDFDDMLGKVVPLSMAGRQPGIVVSWYLCVYAEGDEVRAELSCPAALEGGFFAGFLERIVLIGSDPGDGITRRRDDDDGPEYEIPVTRKAQ